MKYVKSDIDPVKWIGDTECPAIAEAQPGVPLAKKDASREPRDSQGDDDDRRMQQMRREFEVGVFSMRA